MDYYTMCLGNFHNICEILFFGVLSYLLSMFIIYIIAFEEDKNIIKMFFKKHKTVIMLIFIISCLGIIFIPSKDDLKYSHTVDKIIEYVSRTDLMFISK